MKRALPALLLVMAAAAGCDSPEAHRSRAGGPGADVGNRPENVRMHEGSEQFWKTPRRSPGGHPPLESSEQARQVSLQ